MKKRNGPKDDVRCHSGYQTVYRKHYACFQCRKMFNLSWDQSHACPECREPMHNMGWDFKPPRKHDKNQWKKAILLYTKGVRWQSPVCGCQGPGHNFCTPREAKEYQPTSPGGGVR